MQNNVRAMGEIINLRRERKRAARRAAEFQASVNRVLHGRSKTERDLDATRRSKARHELEQHRLEPREER